MRSASQSFDSMDEKTRILRKHMLIKRANNITSPFETTQKKFTIEELYNLPKDVNKTQIHHSKNYSSVQQLQLDFSSKNVKHTEKRTPKLSHKTNVNHNFTIQTYSIANNRVTSYIYSPFNNQINPHKHVKIIMRPKKLDPEIVG